jgi:hypothetical protein
MIPFSTSMSCLRVILLERSPMTCLLGTLAIAVAVPNGVHSAAGENPAGQPHWKRKHTGRRCESAGRPGCFFCILRTLSDLPI